MSRRFRRLAGDIGVAALVAGLVSTALGGDAAAVTPAISVFTTSSCAQGAVFLTPGPDGNVWFGGGNGLGRIDPSGTVTEFGASGPAGHSTVGPDGNLWYTDRSGHIGRLTPSGALVAKYTVPGTAATTEGLATGGDGNVWFIEDYESLVGRITPSGVITTYPTPTSNSYPSDMVAGPNGDLWFVEHFDRIGRVVLSGLGAPYVIEYSVGRSNTGLTGITAGPDGNIWFTETTANRVGRITPYGGVTDFSVPTPGSGVERIVSAADGNLWFTEPGANQLGTITTSGAVTEHPMPPGTNPQYIASGADGNLWFAAGNGIGRYPLSGVAAPAPPAPVTHGESGGQGSALYVELPIAVPCSDDVIASGRTKDYVLPASTSGPNESITGAVVDVSVTGSSASGSLTVYPTGQPRPSVAQLRFSAGTPARGQVVVPVGPGDSVTVYNSAGSTHVDLQVGGYLVTGSAAGYHTPSSGLYVPLPPRRLVDTRTGSGLQDDGVHPQPGTSIPVVLNGMGGLPGDSQHTAILNVSVLNPTANGTLQLTSPNYATPLATMAYAAGRSTSRRLLVGGWSANLSLQVASADVTVDLDGYFTGGFAGEEGQVMHPVGSAAIADTSSGSGLPGDGQTVGPGGQLSVAVAGTGGVPPISSPQRPTAALLDVAIIAETGDGALTVGASGATPPPVPDLIWTSGDLPSNLVVVPVGADGRVTLSNATGRTDVRVTVEGWMSAGTDTDLPVTAPSQITLSASVSASAFGSSVSFTAVVTGSGGTPTGVVTFLDGIATLGSATVSASGQASYATSALAPGGHTITAIYGGDGSFTSSTSAGVSEVVTGAIPSSTPTQRYVQQVYRDLLGREVDAGGLQYWSSAIDQGQPRYQIALSFTASTEYRGDRVQAAYQRYLRRSTDGSLTSGGEAYWIGYIAQGGTFEGLEESLIASGEYYLTQGGGTNQGYVTAVYHDLLGRDPDPGGLGYWVGRLDGGDPRSTIAAAFLTTYEAFGQRVSAWYQSPAGGPLMHHPPDPSGLAYWVGLMQHGYRDEFVISSLVGSDEYYQYATSH